MADQRIAMVQKIKYLSIIIGTIFLSLTMIRSGLFTSDGLSFWGPNGHDGIWHLSLINHNHSWLKAINPGFSGETLINYHPFYDQLLGIISFYLKISPSLLLFQIFPVILSWLILALSYQLSFSLTKNRLASLLTVFFVTFSQSFGWIVTLIKEGRIAGESLFWAMQSISTQINPPYALSLVFLLLLIKLFRVKTWRPHHLVLIFCLLVLLPITKIYGGLIGGLLFTLEIHHRFRRSFNYRLILYFILVVIGSGLVFKHFNPSSSVLIQFKPFWFIQGLFQSSDKLFVPKIASFIFNGHFYDPRLWLVYLFGIFIFILGNFGFRSLAFPYYFQSKFKFLLPAVVVSVLLPLFFIQQGTAWNTIQFLYYGLFFANFFLAEYLSRQRWFFILPIVAITLIANIDTLTNYLGNPAPAAIPQSEIPGLKFLAQQKPGIVLTPTFNPYERRNFSTTPIPLSIYETSAYVSAYTPHLTFLADEMNQNNSNYPWKKRYQEINQFFDQKFPDRFINRGLLINHHIDYLYLTGYQKTNFPLDLKEMQLSVIYQDQTSIIYRVLK